MLPDGRVTDWFAGEERQFLVRIPQLREIQKRCGAGPATIAQRLGRCVAVRQAKPDGKMIELITIGLGDWHVDDIVAPIKEGLIAAGMSANDAGQLVKKEIEDRGFRGLFDNCELALLLIIAGVEAGDEAGEGTAPKVETTPTPATVSSTSAPSTEPASSSASADPARSTSSTLPNSTPVSAPGTPPKPPRRARARAPRMSNTTQ